MAPKPTKRKWQQLLSSFLDIVAGQSEEIAAQFLQATSWNLEEAIQLFYIGNEGGNGVASSSITTHMDESPRETKNLVTNGNVTEVVGDDEVRAPLSVKRETLHGDVSVVRLQPSSVVAFRNFEEESEQPESDQSAASTTSRTRDNLASLYHPPFALMYQGTFDKAKVEAFLVGKWLLVNLQSTEEFSSHMLNRDTWANEAVAQTISTNFIFWQVYDNSTEGKKVCTYYNLVSIPAILIIDPVTGQKMRSWSGMVQPNNLLEDLLQYMDTAPKNYHAANRRKRCREISDDLKLLTADKRTKGGEDVASALAAFLDGTLELPAEEDKETRNDNEAETSLNEKFTCPPLPEEPRGSKELVCRVRVRLPDGKRLQRSFLRTDPIKLLWSFCCSLLEDAEMQPFHFTQAIPGASKSFYFTSKQAFEEAGLSNSLVYLVWDEHLN